MEGIMGQQGGHDADLRRGRDGDPGDGDQGRPLPRGAAQDGGQGRLRGRAARPGRGPAGEARDQADARPLQEGRRARRCGGSRSSRIDAGEEVKAGDEVKASIFAEKEYVDVIGTSKGKGFQGVMKRHHFGGGRAHATARCSTARRARSAPRRSPRACSRACAMAGRMGGERVTVKNLQVVKVDAEQNLIYVRGAVPGPINGLRRDPPGEAGLRTAS